MVKLNESFDPNTVEDSNFDLLPVDRDFMVQGIESDLKDNNARTGTIIALTLEIIEGEFERRRIWLRYNYTHNNAQAQEIARRDLKKVLTGVGLPGDLEDTEQLLWTPFMCRLGIEKGSGNYDDRNNIKRAWPVGTESPYAGRSSGGSSRPGPGASSARSTGNGGSAASRPANNNNRPGPGSTSGFGSKPWGTAGQRATKQDAIDDDIPF